MSNNKKGIMERKIKRSLGISLLGLMFISFNAFLITENGFNFLLIYWGAMVLFMSIISLIVWLFND